MTKSTSDRLNQIMKERNLKQIDILNRSKPYQEKYGISMSKSHLSQYVNGKSQPDQHKLFLLAETLNVNEAWLMGYDVEKEPVDFVTQIKTYDLGESFRKFGFELEYKKSYSGDTVIIKHPNHGNVETIDLSNFLENGEKILGKLNGKYGIDKVNTIAAHHEGEEWTEEELDEIERFKEFVKSKRKQQEG